MALNTQIDCIKHSFSPILNQFFVGIRCGIFKINRGFTLFSNLIQLKNATHIG